MKIKKGWKITWITLGSLLGLVVVAVVVALWLIFTPSKLTKIVNGLSDKFITCEAKFGNVDLTLLSTFPDAGLKIENVVIVNPMEGTSRDTVARIGSLTVGIDVMAFLKDNKVIVHQVKLDDARADLYIAKDGRCNFDIFPKSEKEDTSSTSLPELIDLKKVKVSKLNAAFFDQRDCTFATVNDLELVLKGSMKDKDIIGNLKLEVAKLLVDMPASRMLANLEGLEMKADGAMKGENIDADVRLDAKGLEYRMKDTLGNQTLLTMLEDFVLKLDGKGTMDELVGDLKMKVEGGKMKVGETEMVNEQLRASKKDLLKVDLPHFTVKPKKKELRIDNSQLTLADYGMNLSGQISLPHDGEPLRMDVNVNNEDSWQVKPLLAIVPQQYTKALKGMDIDGKVDFDITAAGTLSDSTMPEVAGTLRVEKGRFYAPKMLPYKLEKVKGKVETDLYLDKSKESWVKIEGLKAHTRGTDVDLSGRVDDLLGEGRVDARVKGSLPFEDLKPMIPETVKLTAQGDAELDIHTSFKMSHLLARSMDEMKAQGSVKMKNLRVVYDSLEATTPWMDIALHIPSQDYKGLLIDARVKSGKLEVEKGQLKAEMEHSNISLGINDMLKQQLAASFDLEFGETETETDSALISLGGLTMKGSVRFDSTQSHPLLKINPTLEASTHSAVVYLPSIPDAFRLSELVLDYKPNHCDIKQVKVRLGYSDFSLYGTLDNIENWISHKAMLNGDLNFTSSYADVDQLLGIISGMGNDKDSLEMMRQQDSVPIEANPFIVPKDVDITLHTHIQRSVVFGNDLSDVAGSLTVKDGVAVLDQMGFVCKAARMQLTGLYKSQRPNNLFCALDFHLLDIQIHELLDMIPAVDTLVPMLKAFDGNANFHLAGETFMYANYQLKMPSVKGAAAISGKNLVVMDNSNIARIAKFMRFKKWGDKDNKIKIDSLSVEMTCNDDGHGTEIEVLPFLFCMGSYKICASGVQQFDKSCIYHLELLKNPLLARVGVDVTGSLTNPHISLGKLKYSEIFRPQHHGVAEKKALEIKEKTRKALEAKVR